MWFVLHKERISVRFHLFRGLISFVAPDAIANHPFLKFLDLRAEFSDFVDCRWPDSNCATSENLDMESYLRMHTTIRPRKMTQLTCTRVVATHENNKLAILITKRVIKRTNMTVIN